MTSPMTMEQWSSVSGSVTRSPSTATSCCHHRQALLCPQWPAHAWPARLILTFAQVDFRTCCSGNARQRCSHLAVCRFALSALSVNSAPRRAHVLALAGMHVLSDFEDAARRVTPPHTHTHTPHALCREFTNRLHTRTCSVNPSFSHTHMHSLAHSRTQNVPAHCACSHVRARRHCHNTLARADSTQGCV
jgi:hypothetical protein